MENKYKRSKTTVSMFNYHFVFCPRYRRKIFLVNGVETRFKELTSQICEANDIDILAMECNVDHCHLFVSALPKLSPAEIMKIIKGHTAKALMSEFSEFQYAKTIWTRSYFVSTAGKVSSETIKKYVESQRTRG